jgi:hypothetical protein
VSIKTARVNVGMSATRLDGFEETDYRTSANTALQVFGQSTVVHNRGAASVFVGGPDVTTANGFELAADGIFTADLHEGDDLYAVTASGTQPCDVLQAGV